MYKGSVFNLKTVLNTIEKRWGVEEVKQYKPCENCLTFNEWKRRGYKVNKGEKAIKIITFVEYEKADGKKGVYPKTCNLFYYKQVSK